MWAQKSPPKKCASISSFTLGTLSKFGHRNKQRKNATTPVHSHWAQSDVFGGAILSSATLRTNESNRCRKAVIRCGPYINNRTFGCHRTVNLRLWRQEKWREYLGGLSYKPWEPSFLCGLWLSFDSCFFWLPGLHLCIIQSLIDLINANSYCGHLKHQWAQQQQSCQWHFHEASVIFWIGVPKFGGHPPVRPSHH